MDLAGSLDITVRPDLLKRLGRLEAPRWLRLFVRARAWSLLVLAAMVGVSGGLVATAMGKTVELLHELLFGLGPGESLSAHPSLSPILALGVPVLGGLGFGLVSAAIRRRRPKREIDPVEANALHGGRMSLTGSLVVAFRTVWSSGVGASVGLEAGYTQLSSGIASRIGQSLRLRRSDLRILVGCGAAAGIAGAFGAPFSGAFYAFEVIIGSYSVFGLAPVTIAAVIGYFTANALLPAHLIVIAAQARVAGHDLFIAAAVGVLAAFFGIALMRGVPLCEAMYNRLGVRQFLRPAIGGAVVGALAVVSPQVMSSGHGALYFSGVLDAAVPTIALVLTMKSLASVVSLGSGFRGGFFFSSLLVGALAGKLLASGIVAAWPSVGIDPAIYAVVGMSALSASVIGAPLTMTFIAIEATGDLRLTAAVLIAVVISTQVTRALFGYSFATWRFHLRGEVIRSAADVGWIRDLTVARMMRHDIETVPSDMSFAEFRAAFPLGSTAQVVAVDREGRYAGLIIVSEAHATQFDGQAAVGAALRHSADMLFPAMNVREAVAAFDRAEAEALAVVDSDASQRVVGILTEAYVLRRYANELERHTREYTGEV
jgi:CIC family chloride channel protein